MKIRLLIEHLLNDLDLFNGDIVLSYKENNFLTKYQYNKLLFLKNRLKQTSKIYYKQFNKNGIKYHFYLFPISNFIYSIIIPDKSNINKVKKIFIKEWKAIYLSKNNYLNSYSIIENDQRLKIIVNNIINFINENFIIKKI